MAQLPADTSVEAEYADGYVHNETLLRDVSPYVESKNILNDIIEKRPEAEHGPMVRFSAFYKGKRYDIDWTKLPDNARPIRVRTGNNSADFMMTDNNTVVSNERHWWSGMKVGYQYNDETGRNVQEIREAE